LSEVSAGVLDSLLATQVDFQLRRQLDLEAPSHLAVPSGSRLPIDYSESPPVLSVRLQEVFGLVATPAVRQGRTPLMLHLLSPARRPIAITQDLAAFWAGSYTEVRRQLRGRYPKHYWPDDPLNATATAGLRAL
jgi:ATP-dependent helicase HrpB